MHQSPAATPCPARPLLHSEVKLSSTAIPKWQVPSLANWFSIRIFPTSSQELPNLCRTQVCRVWKPGHVCVLTVQSGGFVFRGHLGKQHFLQIKIGNALYIAKCSHPGQPESRKMFTMGEDQYLLRACAKCQVLQILLNMQQKEDFNPILIIEKLRFK